MQNLVTIKHKIPKAKLEITNIKLKYLIINSESSKKTTELMIVIMVSKT